MTGRLQGKVAIVTGAGSGIGAAIATKFAEEGAILILNDIDPHRSMTIRASISGAGHISVDGDMSLAKTSMEIVRAVRDKVGKVDILVNNAGIIHCGDIDKTTEAEFDRVVAVNLKSMFLASQAIIPLMVAQQSGVLVNIGSLSGMVGMEFDGASTWLYSTTKSAVFQFSRSLASRYAADGIRVNTLAPGATRTNQLRQLQADITQVEEDAMWRDTGGKLTLLGRVGEPEEIARAALFLASDDSSYVTGQHILVDGGYIVR